MLQLNESGSTLLECLIAATLFLALLSEPILLLRAQLTMEQKWRETEEEIEALWYQRVLADIGSESSICTTTFETKSCELHSEIPLLKNYLRFTGWPDTVQ